MKPKNQYQLVIYLLLKENKPFSLKDVINDSMFFKFQTRLSEIENDCSCFIAKRERVKFENRFGHKSTYNVYSRSIPKEKLIELFNRYE
jgi:hypothetical protein